MKTTKKRVLKKKSFLSKYLKQILVISALLLGISSYLAFTQGIDPLSFLASPTSINLADGLEAEEAAFLQRAISRDRAVSGGGTGAGAAPVVKVTVENKEGKEVSSMVALSTVDTNKPIEDIAAFIEAKVIREAATAPLTNAGLSGDDPVAGASCPGNSNGVKIGSGQWAQSGIGYQGESGNVECTGSSGCSDRRECVKCVDGTYDNSTRQECGKGDATIYITRPDESASDPAKKANCYKGSVIFATGTNLGDQWCFDGSWKNNQEYIDDRNADCASKTSGTVWDGTQCTPPPKQPTTPTEDEIKKAEEKCAKAGRYHISGSTDCGVLKPIPPVIPPATTFESCEMPSGKSKMIKSNINCSDVPGTIDYNVKKNTKNPSGKLYGGEVVSAANRNNCKYGSTDLERNLFACLDFQGNLPKNSNTLAPVNFGNPPNNANSATANPGNPSINTPRSRIVSSASDCYSDTENTRTINNSGGMGTYAICDLKTPTQNETTTFPNPPNRIVQAQLLNVNCGSLITLNPLASLGCTAGVVAGTIGQVIVLEATDQLIQDVQNGDYTVAGAKIGVISGARCLPLLASAPGLFPNCMGKGIIVGSATGATIENLTNGYSNQSDVQLELTPAALSNPPEANFSDAGSGMVDPGNNNTFPDNQPSSHYRNRENFAVENKAECSGLTSTTNKKIYCLEEGAFAIINPKSGLRIDQEKCDTDKQCDSNFCQKNYWLGIDDLSTDRCATPN